VPGSCFRRVAAASSLGLGLAAASNVGESVAFLLAPDFLVLAAQLTPQLDEPRAQNLLSDRGIHGSTCSVSLGGLESRILYSNPEIRATVAREEDEMSSSETWQSCGAVHPRTLSRWAALLVLLAVASCEAPETGTSSAGVLRVMPLGDSITESVAGRASYRYWLWKQLEEAGIRTDFVGSMHGVHAGESRFGDFDADHEGHWGWTSAHVVQRIDEWAALNPPDLVLIHLGSNDIGRFAVEQTMANLTAIAESLRRHNPRVRLLVAQLIPAYGFERRIKLINDAIPDLVARLDTPKSRVLVVDQWSDFDVAGDTWDGVHPNQAGEQKMARRWLAAIREAQAFR
jgi:acyl-CoA thioesterase-1